MVAPGGGGGGIQLPPQTHTAAALPGEPMVMNVLANASAPMPKAIRQTHCRDPAGRGTKLAKKKTQGNTNFVDESDLSIHCQNTK